MKQFTRMLGLLFIMLVSITACRHEAWNDPHKDTEGKDNVFYSSFSEPPKTLDPALAYSSDEIVFVAQIYEPPLQYHYLKRPYTLIPLTAAQWPRVTYWDRTKHPLSADAPANQVAYTTYDIQIQPGIYYQAHPAFAQDASGKFLYHRLQKTDFHHINQLSDFPKTATRELIADDYVYEIKRLASPKLNSPILGLMSKYIVGLGDYAKQLRQINDQQTKLKNKNEYFDLRQYPLAGAQTLDRYTYRITIYGKYPEFTYWLAMPFFAPIPWEADEFYSQPEMIKKVITFDWYPVGTGAYMLTENNPNRQMILSRNPNFHAEYYPSEGEPGDKEKGLLENAGKRLPFIDKFIFSIEKETIPRWNKFLQGYYDASTISSDSFDQAVRVDEQGQAQLTPAMQAKGIRLQTTITPSIYYFGFNMLDNVLGGYDEPARKLRRAISIALNIEEFIKIFLNGRGIPAQGPIPPGIFGYLAGEAGINPYAYTWENNAPKRRSITEAKQLLAEAGYPNGRNAKTGAPLIINYDAAITTAPDDKARFDWMRQQFAKLGIQLNIRGTQYNRFQEKVRMGNTQFYFWGWLADYPDPENFLFLLYGPNGKVKFGGENNTNYENLMYDQLFEQMVVLPNGPQRQATINQMLAIIRNDAPWVWGLHLKDFVLLQAWVGPIKPDAIGNNTLKYQSIDPVLRAKKQHQWNQPKVWPLGLILALWILLTIPIFIKYWRKQHTPRTKKYDD